MGRNVTDSSIKDSDMTRTGLKRIGAASRRCGIAREISAHCQRLPKQRKKKMGLKQLNDHRERPELHFCASNPAGMKRYKWKASSPQTDAEFAARTGRRSTRIESSGLQVMAFDELVLRVVNMIKSFVSQLGSCYLAKDSGRVGNFRRLSRAADFGQLGPKCTASDR